MTDHWGQVGALFKEIAPICSQYDSKGANLHFVSHGGYFLVQMRSDGTDNNTSAIFQNVQPDGLCHLGRRLKYILDDYIQFYIRWLKGEDVGSDPKPLSIVVITAGAMDDHILQPLMRTAIGLDILRAPLFQVGVHFFHVKNEEIWGLKELYCMAERFKFRPIVGTEQRVQWTAHALLETVRNSVGMSVNSENKRSKSNSVFEYDSGPSEMDTT
ncbi:hypothetical protein F4776DRAFT_617644 [Hypoxylon sp. NC0597]|nr:hypothetical protein F4776DRAFT_617644 [Hypoxylon sp. NC0597]